MKISICIPVYNFEVGELVNDLRNEISEKNLNAEILLIDDASDEKFIDINKGLQQKADHFIFLEKNIGRSRIRNLFLDYSGGDYLLFLDCDGKIIEKNFLENYISFIVNNPATQVIYGGRTVSKSFPDQDHYLRWKFAIERENLPVNKRLENPYLSFQTNNFIIKKETLQKVHFNPEFQKYGYEDLLFAMDLRAENIKIDHIENPVFNNDVENNQLYLEKVKESVESLSNMLKNKHLCERLSEVKLVKAYHVLKNQPLRFFFKLFFSAGKGVLKDNLLKRTCSLRYLDFYKLGLLLERMP